MRYLVLLLAVILVTGSRGQEEVCMKTGACSCETVDGKIDLSPLAHDDGTPRFFNLTSSTDPFYYSWNPCKNFTIPDTSDNCKDVAICQGYYVNPEPLYFNLGMQSDAMFLYDNTDTITLQYVHNFNKTRISVVRLVCDAGEEGKLTVMGERPPTRLIYDLELRSKYACFVQFPATATSPVTVTKATRLSLSTSNPGPAPSPDIKALDTIIFLLGSILLCISLVLAVLIVLVAVLFYKFQNMAQLFEKSEKVQHYHKF